MKAYIRITKEHSLFDQAAAGFYKLGYDIIRYRSFSRDYFPKEDEDILIDDVWSNWHLCHYKGYLELEDINYPSQLSKYLHREIHLADSRSLPNTYPYFVKPRNKKEFSGRVVREFKDVIGITNAPVYYTTDILDLLTEYRVYIVDGEIVGVKHYKGNPFISLSKTTIQRMISEYTTAPSAYSMDVGITSKPNYIVLIECNNAITTGNYGLNDVTYARFLLAGYNYMKNRVDPEAPYGRCWEDDFDLNIIGVCTNPHCYTNL